MTTIIKAKKDLFNGGKYFTKGETYEVKGYDRVNNEAGLMDKTTINDMGEPHIIGTFWRDFKIVK